jgi:hypothetical protein
VTSFVLGGAAKSGTSTLADLLGRHPDVHVVPRKEAHHHLFRGAPPTFVGPGDDAFARLVVSDPAEWADLLAEGDGAAAVGEASVYYLHRPACWPAIAEALGPDGRVLLVLRDPVARIRSAWGHLVRDGREPLDLAAALEAEDERVAAGWEWCWHLRRVSQYHEQLPAVLAAFGPDRVLVADFEELSRDPGALTARTFRFLGVEPVEVADAPVRNPSGAVRSRRLHRLLTQPHAVKDVLRPLVPDRVVQAAYHRALAGNLRPLPEPDPALLAELARELQPVADGVRDLVGLDTSRWCAAPTRSASTTR